MSFASNALTAARAQASSFSDASIRLFGCLRAASQGTVSGVWAHQKGELILVHKAFSFALPRPVPQSVTPFDFSIEAALEDLNLQREFPLLTRMEGPAVVPDALMRLATSYRAAVRLCWQLRRVKGMTFRQLAAECGLIYQHVGDYFNPDDKPKRRSLPGDAVKAVESVLGNTAVSQWHAANANLTVLEVLQAGRRA